MVLTGSRCLAWSCSVIRPASGQRRRQGLVLGNTVGVIDADYEGTCFVSAWNRNRPGDGGVITLNPGDRIAQLVFTRIMRPEFAVVPAFSHRDGRQEGGFGSTGIEAACPDSLAE